MRKHLFKFKKMMALTALSLISSSSYAYNYFPDDFSNSLTTGQVNTISFESFYGAILHNSLNENQTSGGNNNYKDSFSPKYFSAVSNPIDGNIHYFSIEPDKEGKLTNTITIRDFNTGNFHSATIFLSIPNTEKELTLDVSQDGSVYIHNYSQIKDNLNTLSNYYYIIDDNSLKIDNGVLSTKLNTIDKSQYVNENTTTENYLTENKINQIVISILAIVAGLGLCLSNGNRENKKYYRNISK